MAAVIRNWDQVKSMQASYANSYFPVAICISHDKFQLGFLLTSLNSQITPDPAPIYFHKDYKELSALSVFWFFWVFFLTSGADFTASHIAREGKIYYGEFSPGKTLSVSFNTGLLQLRLLIQLRPHSELVINNDSERRKTQ